jgi:hypothetical protein
LTHLARAGLPAWSGNLITTAAIIRKAGQGELRRRLPAPVLDLETSAVAAAAAAQQTPFLGLRAITDAFDEEIPAFLQTAALSNLQFGPRQALSWVARKPRRLWTLVHLWRRAGLAARNLSRALEILLPLF